LWYSDSSKKRLFEPLLDVEEDFFAFVTSLNFPEHFINDLLFHRSKDSFVDIYGEYLQVSKNGHVCEATGNHSHASCALGRGTYTSGVHRFNFIVFYDMAFIGILPANIKPERAFMGSYFDTCGTHGWWIDDHVYVNGKLTKRQWTNAKENVMYELVIDCDQRRLGIRNNEMVTYEYINVNLSDAAFPWRLYVGVRGSKNRLLLL
jgi:hypothetical protein